MPFDHHLTSGLKNTNQYSKKLTFIMLTLLLNVLLFFFRRSQMKHVGAAGPGGNPPEKEQRRKKLYKRSRSMGPKKQKRISHYLPTEDNVSQLIKEFTLDFLLHGIYFCYYSVLSLALFFPISINIILGIVKLLSDLRTLKQLK